MKNKYLWFLVALMVGYGLFEYYRPKPLDWSSTYTNKDKIPFGTKATFELLSDIFPRQKITSLRIPIYNHLTESKLPTKSTYIFVNRIFDIDKNDRRELLKYIANGNTAFISSYDFPDSLCLSFGFKDVLEDPSLRDTALVLNFSNPRFRSAKGYVFKHDDGRNYFKVTDAKKITVLAENERKQPIFIKTTHGKGSIYWHNIPLALTNYYALHRQMSDFAFKSLSYLPSNQPIFWDEYQKQGRFGDDETSIFRYIMQSPALTWAYYLILFGLLCYVIFVGKRTQRIIPVVEPPKNTSLEFVETIGRMYYQQGDHPNLARKKIQYFFNYVRDRFGLRANDEEFIETLSAKSAMSKEDINELMNEISKVEKSPYLTEEGLISLNEKIEDFRSKC